MGAEAKKQIFRDFYSTSKRQFQTVCFEWLSFLFPNLRDAVDLGEVDREGVDLYSIDEEGNYEKVYQCKGFEKVFNDSQLKQCIESIKSFINSGSSTNEYYFIINNRVDSKYHLKLQQEVENIKKLKLAKTATFLTVNSLPSGIVS